MKNLTLILGAMIATTVSASAATLPRGEWQRSDGSVRARIAPCGSKTCATTSWTNNSNALEKVGDKFVMTITNVDRGHWTGSAVDAQRNINYVVDLRMQGDHLTTRGCVPGGTACIDADWTRYGK